ncbi:MAG TPA: ornithine carbamoyltransferase [Acidimicrobiales bacterium]|nr:ornithine carbamoyltransferase [Acidimicrobiales bacterium]
MARNLIDTNDLSADELLALLDLIGLLRDADRDRALPQLLAGRSLAMIFEEPSTRTRVSFEVAMTRLGGHALYLKPGEIHLGRRETLADTARVLSRMCDAIMARTLHHATVQELAAHATVPVINGLSDYNHPTQAVCDLFTMRDHLPEGRSLEDCTVVFVGDRTNVCSSTMHATTKLGMNFVHAAPAAYQAPPEWIDIARANVAATGHGSVTVTDDVADAVTIADFIYTDLWWWVDQEDEVEERRAAFMPRYQVNSDLMARAPARARFLHCLPASRGVEVTDEVLDGPASLAFDQAENRLHAEKAILLWAIDPPRVEPAPETVARHHARIEQWLDADHERGARP